MKKLIYLCAPFLLAACNNQPTVATIGGETLTADTMLPFVTGFPDADVDVNIALQDSVINEGDTLWIDMTITSNKRQKLLFDEPRHSTGGPWYTSGEVIDLSADTSVVEEPNKAIFVSNIFFEGELYSYYHKLNAGESIRHAYSLGDLVWLKTKDRRLQPGRYAIQLFYCNQPSNRVTVRVK